ncbi:MAG: UDP-N-acetylglucosamine--N-acetylmuramyl-(pentapeptide) pyrophosphoryl-undecaprenol N-acetylglucosamine transferase, partial [Deltaproteobacteria bacterium]|nr:UDP-N-acetylglucosamine--N-acetylmuramyl-(pentapeptide) pyrophosphoryl-undecaprenol N-acetylglucosamine transferase [Deltaproteobacteria bacterium]
GSATGFEAKYVPEKKIPFFTIQSGAVKNQGLVTLVKTLFKLIGGFFQSLSHLIHFRPDAVVGVGGYVSVPVCVAATTLRVPLYLQEQNVSVGIANRFLGRFAKRVFLGFEQARKSFPADVAVVTGNPIRREFFEMCPSYDGSGGEILILGGSQGAMAINFGVTKSLSRLIQTRPGVHIVHQTGERDVTSVTEAYRSQLTAGQFEVVPFIRDIVACYQKASLVIARSGALTVSEILQVQRPAIFVPYPRRGQNDQTANAYYLQELGVALTVEQGDRFEARLWEAIERCLQPSQLTRMHENFSRLPLSNALATICDQIESAV